MPIIAYPVDSVFFSFFFLIFVMFIFETERDRAWTGEGQRERETQNRKQAPGSEPSAQSPMRGSNPRTVRSWPGWSRTLNQLRHPGAPNVYLFLRDRERQHEWEREREGDPECEAGSRLWAVSPEPDAGLELTNCETMTWAEVRRLTDWATQAPPDWTLFSTESRCRSSPCSHALSFCPSLALNIHWASPTVDTLLIPSRSKLLLAAGKAQMDVFSKDAFSTSTEVSLTSLLHVLLAPCPHPCLTQSV